jgi:hypothetical protein
MKPSQLICKNGVAYVDKHPDMTPTECGFLAFLDYVDDEAERREKWEAEQARHAEDTARAAEVLESLTRLVASLTERVEQLERKTSSTEDVVLYEEAPELGPNVGRIRRVRWEQPEPEGHKQRLRVQFSMQGRMVRLDMHTKPEPMRGDR